jgi:hypothetical protein
MPAPAAVQVKPEIADRIAGRDRSPLPQTKAAPAYVTQPPAAEATPADTAEPASLFDQFDWVTIALALVALIAAGGLIPFWMAVYFAWFPPAP